MMDDGELYLVKAVVDITHNKVYMLPEGFNDPREKIECSTCLDKLWNGTACFKTLPLLPFFSQMHATEME